jgi:hypothetical protein
MGKKFNHAKAGTICGAIKLNHGLEAIEQDESDIESNRCGSTKLRHGRA